MRPLRSYSLLFLVALSAACHRNIPSLVPTPAAPPPPRLEFRPPEDSELTETVKSSLSHSGAPETLVAEMTTVSRFSSEPGGWLLTQRVTRAGYSRDGVPVKTPVEEVLTRFLLRVRLAADGTYVQVVDPTAAQKAVKAVTPAGQDASALEAFFDPEALDARTRAEWDVKYGGLYGRALPEPGQRVYGVGSVSIGGHEVTYLLERTFTGTMLSSYGEAMVFALRCLEDPGEDAPPAVLEALRLAGNPELTPGVQCEGEQLLGRGRFLPVRRDLTLRAEWDGQTWTWATHSELESVQALDKEEQR